MLPQNLSGYHIFLLPSINCSLLLDSVKGDCWIWSCDITFENSRNQLQNHPTKGWKCLQIVEVISIYWSQCGWLTGLFCFSLTNHYASRQLIYLAHWRPLLCLSAVIHKLNLEKIQIAWPTKQYWFRFVGCNIFCILFLFHLCALK